MQQQHHCLFCMGFSRSRPARAPSPPTRHFSSDPCLPPWRFHSTWCMHMPAWVPSLGSQLSPAPRCSTLACAALRKMRPLVVVAPQVLPACPGASGDAGAGQVWLDDCLEGAIALPGALQRYLSIKRVFSLLREACACVGTAAPPSRTTPLRRLHAPLPFSHLSLCIFGLWVLFPLLQVTPIH